LSGYYDATRYVIARRLRTDVIVKPQIGYLEQDKFDSKLKEKREQELSRDQKLSNEEFDEQEQKEIRAMDPLGDTLTLEDIVSKTKNQTSIHYGKDINNIFLFQI
jgi:hypothetical protein